MSIIWILLCAVCFMDSHAFNYNMNLKPGNQLRIKLIGGTERLMFTPLHSSQSATLWSTHTLPVRGKVTISGDGRQFIITSLTFDDQGTYSLFNSRNRTTSVYLVNITPRTGVEKCVLGRTLTIPLGGYPKNEVYLRFLSEDRNVTLVRHGLAVGNANPEYYGRVQVTDNNIQILNVNVSDEGNYSLTDNKDRTLSLIRMSLTDDEGISAAPFVAVLMLLGIPSCICCCGARNSCKKKGAASAVSAVAQNTVKFTNSTPPAEPPPAYNCPTAAAVSKQAFNPEYNNQDPVYPPVAGFPAAQSPQWAGSSYSTGPSGYDRVMYNTSFDSEPTKRPLQDMELSATTPLLKPPQSEAVQPAVLYPGIHVDLNENSDSSLM